MRPQLILEKIKSRHQLPLHDQKNDQKKNYQQGKSKTYKVPTQTVAAKESSNSAQSAPAQKSSGNTRLCLLCKSPSHLAMHLAKRLC